MNNEMQVSKKTYIVVDDHGMARNYSSISSAQIEDRRLILRSEGGNVIASFSSWKSSSILPTPDDLATTNENI
jgi:hypothetical protein